MAKFVDPDFRGTSPGGRKRPPVANSDDELHGDSPAESSAHLLAEPAPAGFGGVSQFMGGKRLLKSLPQTRAEVHSAIVSGVPYASLVHLMDNVLVLSQHEVAEAVGISSRTLRRQRVDPDKPMPPELASKTWLFAETLVKASAVLGGREAAERWMTRPAMGLDGARPIDLLRTIQGAELVNEFLGRLEYGVYN